MASYAFATLQARQTLQELWEQGKTVKDMAAALDVPLSTLYTELRRGRSGVRSRTSDCSMMLPLPSSGCSSNLSEGKAEPLRP